MPPGTYEVLAAIDCSRYIEPDTLDIEIEGEEQTISFHEGWNFISLYCKPETTNLTTLLAPVWGHLNSVWSYNAEGHWWPKYVVGGPAVRNSLKTIKPGKGYLVNMSGDATLYLIGQSITDTSIELWSGWNLVGCNSPTPVLWDYASLPVECKSVRVCNDLTEEWFGYTPDGPSFLNTSTQLNLGISFWMYVTDACTWDIGAFVPLGK